MFYLSTFFFFNDTATTEIYTLSLHDALPICWLCQNHLPDFLESPGGNAGPTSQMSQNQVTEMPKAPAEDRKSTRLNSSHANISYAVFCLKKKKKKKRTRCTQY